MDVVIMTLQFKPLIQVYSVFQSQKLAVLLNGINKQVYLALLLKVKK